VEELRIQLDSGAEVVAYRSGPESSTAPAVVLLHGIGMTHLGPTQEAEPA
jgi:hypothetical protein